MNWEKGTCDFDSEEFKEFLVFARDYQGGYRSKNLTEAIHSGEIVVTYGWISAVSDYQIEKALYGENLSFIGLPTQKESWVAAYFGGEMAVNARSPHQEAAWEFLKYYILNGSQKVAKNTFITAAGDSVIVYAATREEEASYYFRKKKDVNAVVDVIQNRVTLYLQEMQ